MYALDIHGSAHAVNMPVYMRERTGSRPVGTAGAGDRWRRKEYTRNTLEIGNALPTAVDGSIENEIAARRTVGGPRIGTYLLINLYRLFRAARTNRNTDVEAEERKKKKDETILTLFGGKLASLRAYCVVFIHARIDTLVGSVGLGFARARQIDEKGVNIIYNAR